MFLSRRYCVAYVGSRRWVADVFTGRPRLGVRAIRSPGRGRTPRGVAADDVYAERWPVLMPVFDTWEEPASPGSLQLIPVRRSRSYLASRGIRDTFWKPKCCDVLARARYGFRGA